MQFSVAIVALFAGIAAALPTSEVESRQLYAPCSGLYSNAQCCGVDVLSLADIDCGNPSAAPTDGPNFEEICVADGGKRARCCAIPILGQALLCNTPIGVSP
ncbi:Trihydrophobin [Podospora australis]|uniref:Trihydrophobin n=1 Tax=Podospora australis TaxID=1536484 RepID=A0AAN6WUJ0_9PEZI|nr:Trihydrophobin [Podospora australis]